MPKEEVLDALGCLYHLLQREGPWMAAGAGQRGAVDSALLASIHVLQVRPLTEDETLRVLLCYAVQRLGVKWLHP